MSNEGKLKWMQALFEKCQNLAYYKDIRKNIPETWEEKFLRTNDRPEFKYAGNPNSTEAVRIKDLFDQGMDSDKLSEEVNNEDTNTLLTTEILFEVILLKSKASVEHTKKFLAKHNSLLTKFTSTTQNMQLLVQTIAKVWTNNPQ